MLVYVLSVITAHCERLFSLFVNKCSLMVMTLPFFRGLCLNTFHIVRKILFYYIQIVGYCVTAGLRAVTQAVVYRQ